MFSESQSTKYYLSVRGDAGQLVGSVGSLDPLPLLANPDQVIHSPSSYHVVQTWLVLEAHTSSFPYSLLYPMVINN